MFRYAIVADRMFRFQKLSVQPLLLTQDSQLMLIMNTRPVLMQYSDMLALQAVF